jgi:DNA transposition AAA+ family ATPase
MFTKEQETILMRVESRLASGVSRLRLSLETGIRPDQLDPILKRQPLNGFHPDGDHSRPALESLAALEQWLENAPEGRESRASRAETPSFKAMSTIFSIAHQSRSLVAITGPVGFGKSFAAKCYAAEHPRTHQKPGAVRIQFNPTDNKPSALLSTLLCSLQGESIGAYRNGNLYQALGAKLRPGDCLLLDECQRLETAVDVVASLHDDFGIGIVMLGNPDFSRAIWGKDRTFDALGSRMLRHDFPHTTDEDVESFLAWKGTLEGLPVKERVALLKAAVSIGTRPGREGGLRTLNQLVDFAADAYGKQQTMTGPLLSMLVKQLKESA